jgi:hypothetical protein
LPHWLICAVGVLSISINWLGAQFGFADSLLQHIQHLVIQGPTLPVLGAVVSHSISHESSLYFFAANWHAALTLAPIIGLVGVFALSFKGVFWKGRGDRRAGLRAPLAENR